MEKIPVTREGFLKLEQELKYLKNIQRPQIIQAIAQAREHGDLSENAEYHAARERQSFMEGRILEVENVISRADIIDVGKLNGDIVRFGATVKLLDEDSGENSCFQIVGSVESDLEKGKISLLCPLAKALIGKKRGDSVEVITPSGEKGYEILEVTFF